MSKVQNSLFREYKQILLDGCSVDYRGKLCVCFLSDYYQGRVRRVVYQVHCSDSRYLFSQCYRTINEAMDKFFELKGKLKK